MHSLQRRAHGLKSQAVMSAGYQDRRLSRRRRQRGAAEEEINQTQADARQSGAFFNRSRFGYHLKWPFIMHFAVLPAQPSSI